MQFSARTTPGTTDSGGSGTNIAVIIAALAVMVLVLAVVMGVVAKVRSEFLLCLTLHSDVELKMMELRCIVSALSKKKTLCSIHERACCLILQKYSDGCLSVADCSRAISLGYLGCSKTLLM